MTRIGRGYELDKATGKIRPKKPKPVSVSEKLRRGSSKKVRVPKQQRTP